MNQKYKFTWLLAILLVLFISCFLSVFILTLPALSSRLDLTKDNVVRIANAISGLTAPIIGIVSSVLLFFALIRQTEANEDQKTKSEADMIFLLLNQLNYEIDSFYSVKDVPTITEEIRVLLLAGIFLEKRDKRQE